MSKEVNKEQAKAATQEEIAEVTDDQLDEAAGGGATGAITTQPTTETSDAESTTLVQIRFSPANLDSM